MQDYRIFWGEAHDNTYATEPPLAPIDQMVRRAASHLDFYAAAYYTAWLPTFHGEGRPSGGDDPHPLILEEWKSQERLDREWAEVQDAVKDAYEPGRFVTFPGYEWQGDGSGGDHNVFSLHEGLPIFRVDKLSELYDCLRGREALAIPHHTAYRPGLRGRDWSVFDEELSPFAELYSVHGCSETDEEWIGLRRNTPMGPGFGGGTYQAALDRGYHLGAICSTDNWGQMPGHYGHGTMACLAPELTRESLWQAFKARGVYGVTGDRIRIDFRINDAIMGAIAKARGPREIYVAVEGCDALDRIEVLRNGRVIATHCHQGTWDVPRPGQRSRFKLRIEAGWGPRHIEVSVPERHWHGELTVSGGRMLGSDPCWISPGQSPPVLKGERASFEMRSSQWTLTDPHQNANVFEFEADPGAELRIGLNGLEERGTLADFAGSSREMWFKEECVRMLHEQRGVEPGSPQRDDIYYFAAYKAKIHRPIPESGYRAEFSFVDDEPLEGEANYRVRVEQRNGQRAWSSPIWVRSV
jgi:hypothetical protein